MGAQRSRVVRFGLLLGALFLLAQMLGPVGPEPRPIAEPAPGFAPPEPGQEPLPNGPPIDETGIGGAQFASDGLLPCQIPGTAFDSVHVGFPRDEGRLQTTGVITAAAVFVDFPNAPATEPTSATLERNWPQAEEYLEAVSGGRVDFQVIEHPVWLRLSRNSQDYGFSDGVTFFEHRNLIAEAVALADPAFDFTGADLIWVFSEPSAPGINSSPAFTPLSPATAITAEDGEVAFLSGVTRMTDWFAPATPGLDVGEMVMAHETFHNFGLTDLYEYGAPYPTLNRFVGNFDPLGSFYGEDFSAPGSPNSTLRSNELFAWHQWQLGWVDDAQMLCVQSSAQSALVRPAHQAGGAKAMVVPLSLVKTLVVEARSPARYDADLAQPGVLVYTVDASVPRGQGPIRVQGEYIGDWADASVLLQPGDSMIVDGFRVSAGDQTPDGFEVAIAARLCDGKPITIDMTAGDSGEGTDGPDVILGTAGDDVIEAGGGDDTVCAGDGNDVVFGGDGDDVIFGEAGRDVVRGNPGNDQVDGGLGDDRVLGGIGDDVLIGGEGNDYLGGFGGADTIDGGPGDERIFGGFGSDSISGGPGNDVISGLIGDDFILGGEGDDVLEGDRGNDTINGGPGDDVIRGGNANDILNGDGGDDEVSGGKADDQLSGGDGTNDTCIGNKENTADRADATCETIFGVP